MYLYICIFSLLFHLCTYCNQTLTEELPGSTKTNSSMQCDCSCLYRFEIKHTATKNLEARVAVGA